MELMKLAMISAGKKYLFIPIKNALYSNGIAEVNTHGKMPKH
jgi:hypothetical protein